MTDFGIKVLIVDDEPLARKRIRSMVNDDAEMEIVGECSNGSEALAAILEGSPDLVFLDIQMPELDGLKVIGSLEKDRRPLFIFVTAYNQHGLAAFDADVVDYLLKPFDAERFRQAVNRAKSRLADTRKNAYQVNILNFILQHERENTYLKQITIRKDGRIFLVKVADVCWIEGERNYVRFHVGDVSYLRRESIGNLETQLNPEMFRRIHRSIIVNLNFVKELQTSSDGNYRVSLRGGENLTLSQGYQKNLGEFLGSRSSSIL